MKTLLQLNLNSTFNKNLYRIKRNCLHITNNNPHKEYNFDNICYSPQDINSSIMYDIVVDYSEKNKFVNETESIRSINISQQDPKQSNGKISEQKGESSHHNNTFTYIEQITKEPQYKYTVILDEIQNITSIQQLIKGISTTQIFKKQKIKIGHFLVHQSGIYDFHRSKSTFIQSQTQREQLQKQYLKIHGSIQDNFMWIYNKQINLCQQVKLHNIPQILKNISYITLQQFSNLPKPALGIQVVQNLTKAQQIKHKELQNKKVLQIFIINIGTKIRIVLILFNYNKNYCFSPQERKQLTQLFMMHGVVQGEIKYQTVKVQILNNILKNSEKLYYVMYFPGPKLFQMQQNANKSSLQAIAKSMLRDNNSSIFKPIMRASQNKMILSSLIANNPSETNLVRLYRQKRNTCHTTNSIGTSGNFKAQGNNNTKRESNEFARSTHFNTVLSGSNINSSNQSPQKRDKLSSALQEIFYNYTTLKTKDKDALQRIIKQYLLKKQESLKLELQKTRQRVKELKLSQRIQQIQVNDLKNKCVKALQKMSQNIIQLQKMGVNNVGRHMDWLKLNVEQKKQLIKEQQQEIEEINKKIIQNRKSQKYFHNKMTQFRDRLKKKYEQLLREGKEDKNSSKTFTESNRVTQITEIPLNKLKSKEDINVVSGKQIPVRSHLTQLTLSQLQQLQHHKQKLKVKLISKLKNSSEKKFFFETLTQLKAKLSKLQLTRIEQKYFDLLHQ